MTAISHKGLKFFLNKYRPRVKGSVADYGGGMDAARGVEKILFRFDIDDCSGLDYKTGYDLMKKIKGKKYDVGICMDLLEHVSNPFIVAHNISASLKKGALLFVTAPFVWSFHEYPKDYFRFTPDGLKYLENVMVIIDNCLLLIKIW